MAERPPKPSDKPASPRHRERKNTAPQKPPIQPKPPGSSLSPDISLRHQKMIGRVMITWSKLEAAIQGVIWTFLALSLEDGRILTARNDVQANLIILRALAKRHLGEAAFNELTPVLDRIKARQEDRNFIAHGTWGTLMPGMLPVAMSVRTKAPDDSLIVSESFPSERMTEIVDGINGCLLALIALEDELLALRGKQPRRHPQHSYTPDASPKEPHQPTPGDPPQSSRE